MKRGRPKEWQARLDIMKEMGWPASQEEWPRFLQALKKECCFIDLAERLGFAVPTLVSDMAKGGIQTNQKRIFVDGQSLTEIASLQGVSYHAIYKRYKKGQDLYATNKNCQPKVIIEGKSIKQHAQELDLPYRQTRDLLAKEGKYIPKRRTR